MNKVVKHLLKIANEKADPRSCLHHFAICENCGSRVNILRLAEIINSKPQCSGTTPNPPKEGYQGGCINNDLTKDSGFFEEAGRKLDDEINEDDIEEYEGEEYGG